jgi:hypothetical protein
MPDRVKVRQGGEKGACPAVADVVVALEEELREANLARPEEDRAYASAL